MEIYKTDLKYTLSYFFFFFLIFVIQLFQMVSI